MLLKFVRAQEQETDQTPMWSAEFDGIERAIGLFYSPAFDPTARVFIRNPLEVKPDFTHVFHWLITERTEKQNFLFTTIGFTIEVDEDKLRECIQND